MTINVGMFRSIKKKGWEATVYELQRYINVLLNRDCYRMVQFITICMLGRRRVFKKLVNLLYQATFLNILYVGVMLFGLEAKI